MKIQILLVGLGAIGSKNDHGVFRNSPLTHAGAIFQNSAFELVAAVDSGQANRKKFSEDWQCDVPLLNSVEDIYPNVGFDVAVVASPTHTHFAIICELLRHKALKVIFCEKPFCFNANESKQIMAIAERQGTKIIVNYHRRWDLKLSCFRQEVQSLGQPADVQVTYRKGLYNYGSHIIDLMVSFWGAVDKVRADSLKLQQDGLLDPSISATIDFLSGVRGRINGCDGVGYDLFDMEISYDDFRYRVEAGGYKITKYEAVSDLFFLGYKNLQEVASGYSVGPVCGLHKAYEEIEGLCQMKAYSTSSAENALHVIEVLDAIKESSQNGGALIKL